MGDLALFSWGVPGLFYVGSSFLPLRGFLLPSMGGGGGGSSYLP